LALGTREEQSVTTLSLKNVRKDVAKVEEEMEEGSGDGELRDRRD